MRLERLNPVAFIIIAFTLLYIALVASYAEAGDDTRFRKAFTSAYNGQRFEAMAQLIKAKKGALAPEVRGLITEAARPGHGLEETLTLLDVAVVMATMNIHWNNGEATLLAEAEKALDAALVKK